MTNIVVAGPSNWDIVHTDTALVYEGPGGGSLNTAAWIAQALPVRLITSLAFDERGNHIRRVLEQMPNLTLDCIERTDPLSTCNIYVPPTAEREITCDNAYGYSELRIPPDSLLPTLGAADIVFMPLSYAGTWFPRTPLSCICIGALGSRALLQANADIIVGSLQHRSLPRPINVPLVVMTAGAQGAYYSHYGGSWQHCPAIPCTPLDTTGAGDAFAAGLVSAVAAAYTPTLSTEQYSTDLLHGWIQAGMKSAVAAVSVYGALPLDVAASTIT